MKEGLSLVIVFLAHLSLSSSFLLGSASTPLSTAHSVEQLLDLLLDEKQSRSELELKLNKLEDELTAHWRQTIQQSNNTETEIERLKLSLNKEKSNRRQLEQEYTRLSIEFRNLSLNHGQLIVQNKELEEKIHNLTQEVAKDQRRLSRVENDVSAMNQTFLQSVTTNQAAIASHSAELLSLKQKQGHQSGFTAQSPADGPSASTITFKNTISNIGNQFNSTTGRFTCVYPGVYFFTLSMFQTYSSQHTHCDIRQNGARMTFVDSYTPFSDGYYQASNSVILRLNKGDIISLEGCSNFSTMAYASSFSGFLINTD